MQARRRFTVKVALAAGALGHLPIFLGYRRRLLGGCAAGRRVQFAVGGQMLTVTKRGSGKGVVYIYGNY